MATNKKHSRKIKSSRNRRIRNLSRGSIVVLTFLLSGFVGWQLWSAVRLNRMAEARLQHRQEKLVLAEADNILHPAVRRVFPYSVIPGGIGNVSDIKAAMASDPVVAAHYADFDLDKAHVIQTDAERWVYVSYRVGDKIYWTSKRLRIAPGETLITDGETTARGRCGNLLSDVARQPVLNAEPSSKAFDTPLPDAPPILMAEHQVNPIPDFGENSVAPPNSPFVATGRQPGSAIVPQAVFPLNTTSQQTPEVPVPEPATPLMLLIGLGGVAWIVRHERKRAIAASRTI